MPFVEMSIQDEIRKNRKESEEFRKAWEESREEYAANKKVTLPESSTRFDEYC